MMMDLEEKRAQLEEKQNLIELDATSRREERDFQ